MRFDLAALSRRARNSRRASIPIRSIIAPATQATNLYQAGSGPVVAAWRDAVPGLIANYERSLAQLQLDSAADLSAEIEQVHSSTVTLILTMRARLERWAQTFEQFHRRRWRANVLAATGVDLGTLLGPEDAQETLQTVIERNVGLVRSISDQAREKVADTVFRGLTNRTPPREVAKELRETVDLGRKRALRIASDQASKLGGALNSERRRQAGIDSWSWLHSGKKHPREEHVARNGKLYSENPSRVGKEYQGRTVLAPPATRPGEEPFCGCTEVAVLILD